VRFRRAGKPVMISVSKDTPSLQINYQLQTAKN
jgi:hypothetical protein